MSLGDLGKNLNNSGGNLYAQQQGRMMREAEARKRVDEMREADKTKTEISHLRLHKEDLTKRIQTLTREIQLEKDPRKRADREKEIHKLKNDHLHLDGEIIRLQGREKSSHNIRFNNPHYF